MSVVPCIIELSKEMENKMAVELTDLEIEIATDLAQYDWDGTGKEFWAEVERLATFGENWTEHLPE